MAIAELIPPEQRSRTLAIIGLGHRGSGTAMQGINSNGDFRLAAVCDTNVEVLSRFSQKNPDVITVASLDELLSQHRLLKESVPEKKGIDCAFVAVPHHAHWKIVSQLIEQGIHVLKEKPAGMSVQEVHKLQSMAALRGVKLVTASQRRYTSSFHHAKSQLHLIGELKYIEGVIKIKVDRLDEGWRARGNLAGGGAVLDIGWHLVDTVVGIVGAQYRPTVKAARLYRTRSNDNASYDVEDSAHILLDFNESSSLVADKQPVSCNLRISRVGIEKQNEIIFVGSNGSLSVGDNHVVFYGLGKNKKVIHSDNKPSKAAFEQMLRFMSNEIGLEDVSSQFQDFAEQDIRTVSVMDMVYRAAEEARQEKQSLTKGLTEPAVNLGYQWPRITSDVEEAVVKQLHDNISIYDNGNIFSDFETFFKKFHNHEDWHALLHNSGTNALQALYYAAGFGPGDEIIFPVYTFHATASSAMPFGIVPVFCDSENDGNISPSAIKKAITPRTKAVVITHMWGMPCQMDRIMAVIPKNVLLLEDCSHAIGASINGQMVGTFGDGAAWSLQGQKIITGGEGGIVLTKHAEYHNRQLLWGHYNKRCKVEIPQDAPERKFFLTGAGSKNRAHPIAIAIALNQLQKLPRFNQQKQIFARSMLEGLQDIPFLKFPHRHTIEGQGVSHAFYAFMILFDKKKAPAGLSRESFVKRLNDRGLSEVDMPGSTKPLHKEPLYIHPQEVLPHVYTSVTPYEDKNSTLPFTTAQDFYKAAIKLPVWAYADEAGTVNAYIKIIREVAEEILRESRSTAKEQDTLRAKL